MENYTQNGEFSVTENVDNLTSEINVVNNLSSNLESPENIISEVDSDDLMDSMLSDAEQINSELDLPTSEKYIGGDTDNISVIVDNSNNRITATIKQIKFKTASNFPPAGSSKLLYVAEDEKAIYYWDSELAIYVKASGGASEDSGYDDTEIRSKIKNLEDNKAEKTDLDNYYTKSQTYTKQEVDTAISNVEVDLSGYYTKTETDNVVTQTLNSAKGYTDTKVADLVNSAPETLDTLGEVAKALQDNETVVDALNSAIGNKVDKVEGKGLSTNDYTTEEKTKLAGIEEGANKTIVDDTFSLTSTNPLQNKLITEKFRDVVWKNIDQSINSVKTFEKQPMIADSVGDEYSSGRYIISAQKIRQILRENYQEILVAGNNITIDGNTISANLEGGASIVALTSPVVIYDLPSGFYQLPAGCDLYINSSYVETDTKVTYDNKSVALMVVNTIQNTSGKADKLFYLFAEQDGVGTDTVGNTGSFIVGKAKEGTGSYHVAGTDIKYVTQETDGYINGNKSFVNPVKYYNQYESLATSLNDRTLVDAQWVKAQGYVGSSALNNYVRKDGGTIDGVVSISTQDLTGNKKTPLYLYSNGESGCYIEMRDLNFAYGKIGLNDKNELVFVDENLSSDNVKKLAFKDDIPDTSAFVTETKLAGKGYLTSVPSEYVTETELTNKGYATTSALNNKLNTSDLLGKVYPVGSIYMSITNTSPASFLGGSWSKIGAGYALWTATSGAGGTISAGLPNITGQINSTGTQPLQNDSAAFSSSGALTMLTGNTSKYNSSGNGKATRNTGISFNANNGATTKGIYGNSSTVQPPAYKVYAWRRTG